MPMVDVALETLFTTESRASGKPAMVLIHGSGGSHRHWPEAVRTLPQAGVYALDLPGHDRSGGKSRPSVAAYAAAVEGFVRTLGLGRVILVGHSLGGAIVQTIALGSPAWLEKVVLVGTGCRLRVLPALLDGLKTDYGGTVETMLQMMFGPGAEAAAVDEVRKTFSRTPPEVLHDDLNACDRFDVTGRLSGIRAPTLVVCGTEDRMTPVKYSTFLHEHISGSRLALIRGCGHMLAMENPEAFAAVLGGFVE